MAQVDGDKDEFYAGAEKYWKSIPPTVDGMLGGYAQISSTDIGGSKKFLTGFFQVGLTCLNI